MGVPDELPSPFHFNHAIAAMKWDGDENPSMTLIDHPALGRLRLTDGTLSPESPFDTSPRLAGARALIVHPSTTELSTLPSPTAAQNRSRIEHVWRVDDEGDVEATFSWSSGGVMRSSWSDRTDSIWRGAELTEWTADYIRELTNDLQTLSVDPIDSSNPTWTLAGRYRIPSAVASAGSLRAIELGAFISRNAIPLIDEESEIEELFLGSGRTWSERVRVIGSSRRYVGMLEPFVIENPLGKVTFDIQNDSLGEVIVDREVSLIAERVKPADAAQLEDLRRAVQRINRLVLLFEAP